MTAASGLIGLHGGGEYVRDEPAMDALIAAARDASAARGSGGVTRGSRIEIRVVLVPTAAARQRPEVAASFGTRAFAAAAGRAGIPVRIDVAMVVDRLAAEDPGGATLLEEADLVHFPGGDPDLIPALLGGSRAWEAILRAHARGAVVAGASAGAMALAERCWTPRGFVDGLGVVPGIAVLPHFGPGRVTRWRGDAGDLTWLGLDERTLAIGRPGEQWRVAGAGRAHLVPAGTEEPAISAGAGGHLELPAG